MRRRQRLTRPDKEQPSGASNEPSTKLGTTSVNGHEEGMETDNEPFCYVEVALEDGDCDTSTAVNEVGTKSTVDYNPDDAERGPLEEVTNDGCPVKRKRNRRSLIWKHYEQLDSLAAVRCRICMKKLQCFESGSTSNLHRHMSKRHPELFSQLTADGQHQTPHVKETSDSNGYTSIPPETSVVTEKRKPFSGSSKVSRVPEGERRAFRIERELIEALRRAQREEARALEHQRELLEKLRAMNAREAAAEREQIESLRKTQLEEAEDLTRQREEVLKEKAELQKKWEEFQQEREELVLFSRDQQT